MNCLAEDLDSILEHTRDYWEELRGRQIFITGGTGFFGCWLLETFIWINARLGLNASATVLTRNPEAFKRKAPHLASSSSVRFHQGDIRWFEFPEIEFSHIIHAATESSEQLNRENPLLMLDTIMQGTRRVLDLAVHCRAEKLLLTSSGAVYGKQPADISHIPEEHQNGPDPLDAYSAYAEGKRISELLCKIYSQANGIQVKIARCFAFVGPYLPLDVHFAVGNFIHDSLAGRSLRIKGDGTPFRSYLYASDLMIWLWTILFRGETCRPYNVGSENEVTVRQLAFQVKQTTQNAAAIEVQQAAGSLPADRYVPSTTRARRELGLCQRVDLQSAIQKTYEWNKILREVENERH
jgi:nucleoside-diphosphate-sugar epimerase